MRLFLVAATALGLSIAGLHATAFAQSGSVTTASYEMQPMSAASGAVGSSVGGSYGRIEAAGATLSHAEMASTESSYTSIGGSVGACMPNPTYFLLAALAPAAGLPFCEVLIPKAPELNGPFTVRFDGILAVSVSPAGDNLKATVPAHLPGAVSVTLETQDATLTFENGFSYVPAISAPKETHLGEKLQLQLAGMPGTQFYAFYSNSLNGPTQLPGFEGSLQLDIASMGPLGETTVPTVLPGGATTMTTMLEITIPNNSSLAGKNFFLQALALDGNSGTGVPAFTNAVALAVKS